MCCLGYLSFSDHLPGVRHEILPLPSDGSGMTTKRKDSNCSHEQQNLLATIQTLNTLAACRCSSRTPALNPYRIQGLAHS